MVEMEVDAIDLNFGLIRILKVFRLSTRDCP